MRISDWSSDVCSSDLQSNDKQHADYCPIQAYNHLDHNFPFAGTHIHQAAFPQLAANDRITRQATLTIFRPPLCFWIERRISSIWSLDCCFGFSSSPNTDRKGGV